MARRLVIGNWKMNLDHVEAVHLTQQVGVMLRATPAEHTDVVLAPPFVDLRSVTSVVESERIPVAVGAQHVNPHDHGAHTGEVSVGMLARLGVTSVIVGHSERRALYAMTDEVVAATLRAVVAGGLRPVLCVGEDLVVREEGRHEAHVRAQLHQRPEPARRAPGRVADPRLRARLGDRHRGHGHHRPGALDDVVPASDPGVPGPGLDPRPLRGLGERRQRR